MSFLRRQPRHASRSWRPAPMSVFLRRARSCPVFAAIVLNDDVPDDQQQEGVRALDAKVRALSERR